MAGCVMKQFSARFLAGPLFAAWALALFFALPQSAHAIGMIRISDPSVCVDSMQTDGDSDELEPILVAADGACSASLPEMPISI